MHSHRMVSPSIEATLNNMKPELVLGADIVSNLLSLVARTLLKRLPRAAVSSRHDRSISCHPQYRAAGIKVSSRWNSISRADSPQCRPTELVSPWHYVGQYPSLTLLADQLTCDSNPQRTTTCQPKNCHTLIVTVASRLWNNLKVSIRKSECLKSFSVLQYNA
jgi:hypothetical protein